MKTTNICELPIIPEDYETNHYSRINYDNVYSEMTDVERRFINGLIRWYEPKNILEIGVSKGGGTVNILNAISDLDAKLVSLDRMNTWWLDETHEIGTDVERLGLSTDKWRLITGVDPSMVLDGLNTRFDFCVIDTAHLHPMESVNFLCALPFLNDGAIVVLHDTAAYLCFAAERQFANRILMSAICAETLEPVTTDSFTSYLNIAAFQVTKDTHKYMRNIFDALMLPWEMELQDFNEISCFIERHYSAELVALFHRAAVQQKQIPFFKQTGSLLLMRKPDQTIFTKMFEHWSCLGDNVIFYGAGRNMRYLLETGKELGWCFDYPIWDLNAEQIGEIVGCPVFMPDFDNPAKPGASVVITIDDKRVFTQVRGQLVQLGYRVFHGLGELLEDIRNPHPKRACTDWGGSLEREFPVEFDEEAIKLVRYVEENELTSCSRARTCATIQACRYAVENDIAGDFVECGVWRGGQALLAAWMFKQMGSEKKVWLYDTFEGFVNVERISMDYNIAVKDIEAHNEHIDMTFHSEESKNSLENVKANFEKAGLLSDNVVFVKGDVVNTLESESVPEKVAVLRLDTDFYASTLKELQVLYPRVENGGVLIVDDYGYCEGAKTAVDEYFKIVKRPMLQIIDEFGRSAIKVF